MTIRKDLFIFAGAYSVVMAIMRGLTLLLFLWFAQALSVVEYAQFGILYALQTGVVAVLVSGIISVVIGKQKGELAVESALLSDANSALYFASAGLSLLLIALSYSMGVDQFGGISNVLSVIVSGMLLAVLNFQIEIFRLKERHVDAMRLSFLTLLTGTLASVFAFYFLRTGVAFFYGSIVGGLLVLVYLLVNSNGIFSVSRNSAHARALLASSMPFIVIALVGWIQGYGNNIVIAEFFDAVNIATYTFVISITSVLQMVASSLNYVWNPRFYVMIREDDIPKARAASVVFYRIEALLLGVIGAVLLLLVSPMINTLGGQLVSYGEIHLELLLVLLVYVVSIPWWHAQNYFMVNDLGDELLRHVLLSSVFTLTIWVAFMYFAGPIGIYLGYVSHMVLRSLWLYIVANYKWHMPSSLPDMVAGISILVGGYFLATSAG